MRNFKSSILLFCVLSVFLSSCLSVTLRTANENYAQFAYFEAARGYEHYLGHRYNDQAVINVADCYRQLNNPVKQEFWFGKAVKFKDAKPEWFNYLAQAQMRNGKYSDAVHSFEKYLELNNTDYKAQRMLKACNNLSQFYRDTTLFTVSALKLNIPGYNFFSPAFYKSGIVFLSDYYIKGLSKNTSDETGRRYFDLFFDKRTAQGNWLDIEPLRGNVNGPFNEGPVTFSSDYATMYFTRNNYISNVVEKNEANTNVLKIYRADFSNGSWFLKEEISLCSEEYSIAHPCLNSDGTIMYFVSDMPWGYGGTDIYMTRSEGDNQWSTPVNLGPNINTEGDEMFPFIYKDSVLFFSSDGWQGLGGLDIFESDNKSGNWTMAYNPGAPLNSSQDDFGFIMDTSGTGGYFSSSRNGILDKLYRFDKNKPKLSFNLTFISDDAIPVPVSNAIVRVNEDSTFFTELRTDNSGKVFFSVNPDHDYSFTISQDESYKRAFVLSTAAKKYSENIDSTFVLNRIQLNKPDIWSGIKFKKKEWQLDLSSASALVQLVDFLNENPSLNIEICSYTDSRGSDDENISLTQKRADLVKQYLSNNGVLSTRLSAKGMGETKLLNKCTNGLLCIEEDHQVNNRIEIAVKSITKNYSP